MRIPSPVIFEVDSKKISPECVIILHSLCDKPSNTCQVSLI
jgi:hypothetical protein